MINDTNVLREILNGTNKDVNCESYESNEESEEDEAF